MTTSAVFNRLDRSVGRLHTAADGLPVILLTVRPSIGRYSVAYEETIDLAKHYVYSEVML
jgi:hypothetical protein